MKNVLYIHKEEEQVHFKLYAQLVRIKILNKKYNFGKKNMNKFYKININLNHQRIINKSMKKS